MIVIVFAGSCDSLLPVLEFAPLICVSDWQLRRYGVIGQLIHAVWQGIMLLLFLWRGQHVSKNGDGCVDILSVSNVASSQFERSDENVGVSVICFIEIQPTDCTQNI